jgi:biotin operon repressor
MPRQSPTKAIILSRLQRTSALLSELKALTGISYSGILAAISRLRNDGWDIQGRASAEANNPRYTLLHGPDSLSSNFTCPACKRLIRLGYVSDHDPTCKFGPAALDAVRRAPALWRDK